MYHTLIILHTLIYMNHLSPRHVSPPLLLDVVRRGSVCRNGSRTQESCDSVPNGDERQHGIHQLGETNGHRRRTQPFGISSAFLFRYYLLSRTKQLGFYSYSHPAFRLALTPLLSWIPATACLAD